MPPRKPGGRCLTRVSGCFCADQREWSRFWVLFPFDEEASPGNATWTVPAEFWNPWRTDPGTAEPSVDSRHPVAGGAGGLGCGWSAADGIHPRLVRQSLRMYKSSQ